METFFIIKQDNITLLSCFTIEDTKLFLNSLSSRDLRKILVYYRKHQNVTADDFLNS